MSIKKFYATSPREALNMIRNEFGSEAEIISNKIVNGWVEIIAKAGDIQSSGKQEKRPHSAASQVTAITPDIDKIISEIREMKVGFYEKLDTLAWNSSQHLKPAHNMVLDKVLMAGFSPNLAKRLVEKLPSDYSDTEALNWLREILSRNLISENDEQDFLKSARVIALVGPTGVGKTTTIAKIAARYVMSKGAENLAFITTDAYRVGALEQLKVFGSILGVSVHAVKDQNELQLTLEHLKDRYTILIDTPGLSQRDPRVDAQMAMLTQVNIPIKRILCLNATNHIETSNDVVNVYTRQSIDGCIITKIDEAIALGSVLNVVMQHKLKVLYLTNGQRVPEDIELVDKKKLFERVITESSDVSELSARNDTVFPAMFKKQIQINESRQTAYA